MKLFSKLALASVVIIFLLMASNFFTYKFITNQQKMKNLIEQVRIINSYGLEHCGNQFGLGNYETPEFQKCYKKSTEWFQDKILGKRVVAHTINNK